MKIEHSAGITILTGKPSEYSKVQAWIDRAMSICSDLVIGSDDSDCDETCFTVCANGTTQADRQWIFQQTKKG